jgi:hypothetical protein
VKAPRNCEAVEALKANATEAFRRVGWALAHYDKFTRDEARRVTAEFKSEMGIRPADERN